MTEITFEEFEKLHARCDVTYSMSPHAIHHWEHMCVVRFEAQSRTAVVTTFLPDCNSNRVNRFDAADFSFAYDAYRSTVVITDKRKKGFVYKVRLREFYDLTMSEAEYVLGRGLR